MRGVGVREVVLPVNVIYSLGVGERGESPNLTYCEGRNLGLSSGLVFSNEMVTAFPDLPDQL